MSAVIHNRINSRKHRRYITLLLWSVTFSWCKVLFLFAAGTTASDAHFQAFLLEGIARWNDNRTADAVAESTVAERCYDDKLKAAHSRLSTKVFGESSVAAPATLRYTGELFGVEYLYSQTGRAFQLPKVELDDTDLDELDVVQQDEGFEDVDDLTVPLPTVDDFAAEVEASSSGVTVPAPAVSHASTVSGDETILRLTTYLVSPESST